MNANAAWIAEVESVVRTLTEDGAAKALARLGFDATEIAEMLKEEAL